MRTIQLKRHALLLFFVSLAASASESPPQKTKEHLTHDSFLSPMLGVGLVTTGNGSNFFTYGARANGAVKKDSTGILGLGAFYGVMTQSQTISGNKYSDTISALMFELISRRLWGSNFYSGARLGLGLLSSSIVTSSSNVSGSGTSFAFAPVLGYELPYSEGNIGVSIDVSWVNVGGGVATFTGLGTLQYGRVAAVLINAGLNVYW